MNTIEIDTSRVFAEVSQDRRQRLAKAWNLDDAISLLKCKQVSPQLEDDMRLCVESMLLHCIAEEKFISTAQADQWTAEALGKLAESVEDPNQFDAVCCERVAWVRLAELCWLCEATCLLQLILKGPLYDHMLRVTLGSTTDFTGKHAHVMVAWVWRMDHEEIVFRHEPTVDQPMNSVLRKVFGVT